MKKLIAGILLITVLVALAWTGARLYRSHPTIAAHPFAPDSVHPSFPGASNLPPATPLMTREEFEEYHQARQTVLQHNPELRGQFENILQQMNGQMDQLDAAMLQTDPHLKPVIAKLVALRAEKTPHSVSPSPLTPEEWQELRAARTTAVQADPRLITNAQQVAVLMGTFETSLDAAMVKADPALLPMITRMEAQRQAQRALANASAARPSHS